MSNTTEQKIKQLSTEIYQTLNGDPPSWTEEHRLYWLYKRLEEVITSERTTLREQIEGLRRASGDQDRYNMAIFDVLSLLAHEEGNDD